jgi:hypothetical protein
MDRKADDLRVCLPVTMSKQSARKVGRVTSRSPGRVVRTLFALVTMLVASLAVGIGEARAAVADEANDTWQVNGTVMTVLRVGDTVYVGGLFTQISDPVERPGPQQFRTRNNAAAFSAITGEPTNWDPNANGEVDALAASADGSVIYLGGDFTKLGAETHTKIGAVSPTSGNPISTFDPGANAVVRALGLIGDTLYAGGSFSSVSSLGLTNPQPRGALAAFDAVSNASSDGNVLGWNPGGTSCASLGCGSGVRALTIPNSKQVVVGGGFEAIGGTNTKSIASLSATSGAVQSWQYHPSTPVLALDNDGRYVYMANKTNQAVRMRASDGQDYWHAQADGDIQALTFYDGVLYIGGHFQAVDGNPEPHAAAIIAGNGDLLPWGGGADSTKGIFGMDGAGGVFIGGDFDHIPGPGGEVHREGYAQYREVVPTLSGYLFEEHFTRGDLGQWDKVGRNLKVDGLSFDAAQPGVTGQTGLAFATGFFEVSSLAACAKVSVSVVDPGPAGMTLLTLKTYSGQKIAHAFITADRTVQFQNDVADLEFDTGVKLPVGWSTVQLCGTKGAHGALTMYVDGTQVDQGLAADTDLGINSFGQVEIGDRAKTGGFTFSMDDVVVDTSPIP